MVVVGLTHVHQRQHHENEGLQRNNQNMKYCPTGTRNHMTKPQCNARGRTKTDRTHKRDQHEHQLAGIHISEQPHAV